MSRSLTKAVFLDRDGTINVDRGYVYRTDQFEFISGALEAMRRLTDNGIAIYIVTNQAGIGLGLYTEEDFRSLTEYVMNIFRREGIRVNGVFHCPHRSEDRCRCRKPEIGLFEPVIKDYPKEGLALIGDKKSDIEAGQRLGVRTYLVETGYGAQHKDEIRADHVVADLGAAVAHLLAGC